MEVIATEIFAKAQSDRVGTGSAVDVGATPDKGVVTCCGCCWRHRKRQRIAYMCRFRSCCTFNRPCLDPNLSACRRRVLIGKRRCCLNDT